MAERLLAVFTFSPSWEDTEEPRKCSQRLGEHSKLHTNNQTLLDTENEMIARLHFTSTVHIAMHKNANANPHSVAEFEQPQFMHINIGHATANPGFN